MLNALTSPQVLAGIYPIAQIQEPYTAVGYLASRIPMQALLHLRHPEAEDPSAEHPWCPGHSRAPLLPSLSPSLGLTPPPRLGSQPLIQPQLFPGRGSAGGGFLQTNPGLCSEKGPGLGRD